jgi:hypothetical protein
MRKARSNDGQELGKRECCRGLGESGESFVTGSLVYDGHGDPGNAARFEKLPLLLSILAVVLIIAPYATMPTLTWLLRNWLIERTLLHYFPLRHVSNSIVFAARYYASAHISSYCKS